jgi:hypothetical protein
MSYDCCLLSWLCDPGPARGRSSQDYACWPADWGTLIMHASLLEATKGQGEATHSSPVAFSLFNLFNTAHGPGHSIQPGIQAGAVDQQISIRQQNGKTDPIENGGDRPHFKCGRSVTAAGPATGMQDSFISDSSATEMRAITSSTATFTTEGSVMEAGLLCSHADHPRAGGGCAPATGGTDFVG